MLYLVRIVDELHVFLIININQGDCLSEKRNWPLFDQRNACKQGYRADERIHLFTNLDAHKYLQWWSHMQLVSMIKFSETKRKWHINSNRNK